MELHSNVLAAQSVYYHISLSMQDPSKNTLNISFKLFKYTVKMFSHNVETDKDLF